MTPEEETEEAAIRADLEAAGISSRDFAFFAARDIQEVGIYAPRFADEAAAPILICLGGRATCSWTRSHVHRTNGRSTSSSSLWTTMSWLGMQSRVSGASPDPVTAPAKLR